MEIIKKYLKDEQFVGTVYVTAANLLGGFFAYLLQIYLGQKLSIEDYGTFNAFLSLFTLITVFTSGLGVSTIKVSSELFGRGKTRELSKLFWHLVKMFVILGAVIFVIFWAFKESFSGYLNIPEQDSFIIFGFFLLCNLVVMPSQNYLLGLLKFKGFSFYSVLRNILRTIVAGGLAYFGYSVGILYLGMSFVQLIMFVVALIILKNNLVKGTRENLKKNFDRVINFSVPVLFVFFGLAFFNNIDILMVKKFFDAETAGYYVGAATIGKIILFGIGTIGSVMLPQVSAMHASGKNYNNKLRMFTSVQVFLALVAFIVFVSFPRFITLSLFGERFSNSVGILPLYTLFVTLYVLVAYFVRFFLAINKTVVAKILIPVSVLQATLIYLFHNSIYQVLWINVGSMAVLLIALFMLKLRSAEN